MDQRRLSPFGLAAFSGAFLLFSLELLAAKLLLPRFGGAAYVWTASAAVYQGLLFLGYLYARGALSRLGPRYFKAHVFLLALPLLWLPLSVAGSAEGPHPSFKLVCSLLLMAGAPFFVLSTTAPVVQEWHRRAGEGDGYHLYAASNAGALAALIAYPLLVEPLLSVTAQLRAWTVLYLAFAALHLAMRPAASAAAAPAGGPSTSEERAAWLLLSCATSAALLATTNLLSLDLAAVPLLWAAPLAAYLATFALNFKRNPWYPRHPSVVLIVLVVLWLAAVLAVVGVSVGDERWHVARRLWVLNRAWFYGSFMLVLCLVAHRALAVSRPEDERAPDFYVWIGLGGWLGGTLVGAVLPVLARRFPLAELDLGVAGALGLAGLLLADRLARRQRRLELGPSRGVSLALAFVGALGLGYYARASPVLRRGTVESLRNFYGFHRVGDDAGLRRLHHGGTVHGLQSLDPKRAGEPLLYYHRASPAGEAIFALLTPRARVAAFGLGAGAVAAYARAGQAWTFYELDPDVLSLARARFTYLANAKSEVNVVLGDARLTFAKEKEPVDLLILDVFSSGAVPVHLLTREALALYLSRLSPRGAVLLHVTNRFLDLRGVAADLAADAGLAGLAKETDRDAPPGDEKAYSSWVVLARDETLLSPLAEKGWLPLSSFARRRRVWTDGYAPLWSAIGR